MLILPSDKHLPKKPTKPRQDVHPKGKNPHLVIAGKKFQKLQLAVQHDPDDPDSLLTSSMLEAGPKAATDATVSLWIKEIDAGRYDVVLAK